MRLLLHVGELTEPAVDDDDVTARLEGVEVVGHLAAEEVRGVELGPQTSTGTPLAFARFMMPCTELAGKLPEPVFMVRRYTPTMGASTPEHTSSFTRLRTSSATKSLRVRLDSTIASMRFCGTSP